MLTHHDGNFRSISGNACYGNARISVLAFGLNMIEINAVRDVIPIEIARNTACCLLKILRGQRSATYEDQNK